MVVRGGGEDLGAVAAGAHRLGLLDAERVHVVAVAARHTGSVHAALYERPPDEDLVEDLTVRVVEPLLEQCGSVGVEEALPGLAGRDPGAAGVAGRADVELGPRGPRGRAARNRASGLEAPDALLPELDHELAARRLRAGACLRPGHVRRSRAVARLAGDVDLRPGRLVAVPSEVVALRDVRRVALGAHRVPAAGGTGPVQHVARRDGFFGMEVEPALTALAGGPRVPGDAESLQAPPGERNQVLLERLDAEGVRDLELAPLALGVRCAHEQAPIASFETEVFVPVPEGGLRGVRQYGVVVGDLHGEVVVRAAPASRLVGVAAGASLAADVGGLRRLGGGRGGSRGRDRSRRFTAGERREERDQRKAEAGARWRVARGRPTPGLGVRAELGHHGAGGRAGSGSATARLRPMRKSAKS
jgi:hypothetical protein